MISIETIHIKEFRGIRELILKLDGKNYVIYGPNGSGKSGIVDAIEFALTGEISHIPSESPQAPSPRNCRERARPHHPASRGHRLLL